MTIKMECIIEHAKHDYSEILPFVAAGIAIIGLFIFAVAGITYGPALLKPNVNQIMQFCDYVWGSIIGSPIFTAANIFVCLTALLLLSGTVGIAVRNNKSSFIVKVQSDYGDVTEHKLTTSLIIFLIMLTEFIIFIGFAVWMFSIQLKYRLSGIEYIFPEDVNIIIPALIIFIACVLIGTPIACAIAKCKDD